MLGLRYSQPGCIRAAFGVTGARAGFQRRQRSTPHRFKVLPVHPTPRGAAGREGPCCML